MAKRRGRAKKSLEEKVKDLDPHFIEEVRTGDSFKIKEKLVSLSKYENQLEEARKDDMDLASKREALKIANQTYSDPLNAIKLKRQFALKVLAEKGG